jgi:hypothetical protein
MIADYPDEPLPFGQLILTVNIGLSDRKAISPTTTNISSIPVNTDMRTVGHFNDWFTRLECAGLRPYYFEVSMNDVNNRRLEPSIVYVSANSTCV